MYSADPATGRGACQCKDNYILWPGNGQCYKAFTPGPCSGSAEFIVPAELDEGTGTLVSASTVGAGNLGICVRNPCPRAHLYFPSSESESDDEVQCHKVGSRGPCPLGQLVVFEKYSGKSYRGECGCSPGYNQNYWPETEKCYEWYTQVRGE